MPKHYLQSVYIGKHFRIYEQREGANKKMAHNYVD